MKFEIATPDDIEATMSITMKVSEWKALSSQLTKEWPSWKLSSVISSIVLKAQKEFYANDNDVTK